jgi:hypothetical protein
VPGRYGLKAPSITASLKSTSPFMMTPVQACAHRPVQACGRRARRAPFCLKRQGGTRLPSIHIADPSVMRRGRGREDVDQAATVAIDAERVGIPSRRATTRSGSPLRPAPAQRT